MNDMRPIFPFLLLAAACKPPIDLDDSGPPDTGTDDTGTTPTVPEATYAYVISELLVAPADEGFDLDQDGSPDNALSAVDRIVDPLLQALMADTPRVQVIVLDALADFQNDPSVHVSVFGADDQDGDHSALDNFSGEEIFEAAGSVDEEGHPTSWEDVPLEDGLYMAVFTDVRSVDLGGLQLGGDTPLVVGSNEVDATSQNGLLGFGVGASALVDFAESVGMDPDTAAGLAALADLDLDQDGTDETVSVALRFGAVTCGLD